MSSNDFSYLKGTHSLLSPSSYRWRNYDAEAMLRMFKGKYASTIGTCLHRFAESRIRHGIKLTRYEKNDALIAVLDNPEIKGTEIDIYRYVVYQMDFGNVYTNLMNYVNDAIGFRMEPEVFLYFSNYCYGTADALKFNEKDGFLRIHDLKTGLTPAAMDQLDIYAGLYCLSNNIKPSSIQTELRIYQGNDIIFATPTTEELEKAINDILESQKTIDTMMKGW